MKIVFDEEQTINVDDLNNYMIIVMEHRKTKHCFILSYTDVNECGFASLGTGQFYASGTYSNKKQAINEMNKEPYSFYAFETNEDFVKWYYNKIKDEAK